MDDICIYHIEVRDELEETGFNTASPLQVVVVQSGPAATRVAVTTDQAGLVGLIRHLHRRQYVLLSVVRKEKLDA